MGEFYRYFKNIGVFTIKNVIVSIITFIMVFIMVDAFEGSDFLLIWYLYSIVMAYACRYIALRTGSQYGYVWGFCLGLIGLLIVCALPDDSKKDINSISYSTNKYEDLERLQKLKDNGTITEDEFQREKAKLLS